MHYMWAEMIWQGSRRPQPNCACHSCSTLYGADPKLHKQVLRGAKVRASCNSVAFMGIQCYDNHLPRSHVRHGNTALRNDVLSAPTEQILRRLNCKSDQLPESACSLVLCCAQHSLRQKDMSSRRPNAYEHARM